MSARVSSIARAICGVGLAVAAAGAHAQVLKMGLSSEPTALDPHYHQVTPNEALNAHIFEPLVAMSPDMELQPRLAASWQAVDDTTWEFRLDPNARFSNGEPFTAQDVMFTLCRLLNNETSISGGFANVARRVVDVQAPDAKTVRLITSQPFPVLVNELARVPMIWSGIAQFDKLNYDPAKGCGVTGAWPQVNDFNSGKAAIGTGPYVLKSYTRGSWIELTRNEQYWGDKPEWAEVRMLAVPADGPRLTSLLAGDFDIIENPAARDLRRIKDGGFGHAIKPSVRVVFFQLDVARENSPFVKSPKGDNPLQDVRVRQAISMAIDRKAIVERIMDGVATPAYQFLPDGMFGTLPEAPELKYDPAAAKALLAEAGYPKGFELTLTSTNDRYINDAQVTQAVAQYLARVGIQAKVDTMTRSVYFPRRAKREFSASMGGWGSETGEASNFIQYWTTSTNKELGVGGSNYGGYSNPELDTAFVKAIGTVDDAERAELLQNVIRIALADMPHVPLHFESGLWAFRAGLAYEGRADQRTVAMGVTTAK